MHVQGDGKMLSMWCGKIIIRIEGMVKRKFKKSTKKIVNIIPTWEVSTTYKASNEEEFIKYLNELGNNFIDDWKRQLKAHVEQGYGLVLTGYNADKKDLNFFWTPCFITFEKISFETSGVIKLYDFKDKTMKHCMEHLTPEEMIKEFGYYFCKCV